MSVRIVLVGYGRMGKAMDALSAGHGCEVVERLDVHNNLHGEGIDSPCCRTPTWRSSSPWPTRSPRT